MAGGTMKTSYYLAAAAVLTAAGGAVYTRSRAADVPLPTIPLPPTKVAARSPADMPSLPSIVLGPNETLPISTEEPPRVATGNPAWGSAKVPVVDAAKVSAEVPAPPKPLPPPMLPAVPKLPAVPPRGLPKPPVADVPGTPAPPSVGPLPAVPQPPMVPSVKLPAVPPPLETPGANAPGSPALPSPGTPPNSPKLPAVPPPSSTPGAALPTPTPYVPPAPPSLGSVVLLQDGKLVEGHVTQTADKVIVRRGSIDQPFPKEQVQHIGKTKADAYQFLLGKLKPDDTQGRFKLARWCMYNGLREQALAEARQVVKDQPNHTAAADMARALEESMRLFHPDGTPVNPKPVAATPPAAPALPAAPPAPKGNSGFAAPPVSVVEPDADVTPEAAIAFGPKVQPVLANLCADCHARRDYTGAFKLDCHTGQGLDPAVTRYNLVAVAKQIKKDDPGASPLLHKALTAHGGMKQPVFAGRGSPAYRVLEAWVYLAAGSATPPPPAPPVMPPKPTSSDAPIPTSPLPAVPPPDAKPKSPAAPPSVEKPVLPPVPPPIPRVPPPPIPPAAAPALPAVPPVNRVSFGQDAKPNTPTAPKPDNTGDAVDEFDPSVFNRAVQK